MSDSFITDRAVAAVTPDQPLDLSQLSGAWRVRAGEVELYALVEREGRAVGNRRFTHALAAGDVLFAAPPVGDRRCRLVAFSALGAVLEPVGAPAPSDIAAWMTGLAQAILRLCPTPRPNALALSEGAALTCPGDAAVMAARGLVWAEVRSGEGCLLDDPEAVVVPGMVVPLTAGLWLRAQGGDQSLLGCSGEGVRWSDAQTLLLLLLARLAMAAERAEDDRLRRSTALSRQALAATMTGFAAVFRETGPPDEPAPSDDPLTAACRLVLRSQGDDAPPPVRAQTDAADLVERIARRTRLPARPVRLPEGWWHGDFGPLVGVRAGSGAPVALIPAAGRGYALVDPVEGRRRVVGPDLAAQLEPTAYAVYPTLPSRPISILGLMRFARRTSLRDLRLMFLMNGLAALLGLSIPVATGMLVDTVIPGQSRGQLLLLGGVLLVVSLVQTGIKIVGDLAQLRLSGRAGARAQTAIVERALRLEHAALSRFSSADLAQRALVIDALRRAFGGVAVDSLLSGLFSLISLTLLLFLAPGVASAALGLFALFLLVALWAGHAQLPALRQAEERGAEAASLMVQLVANIAQLRAAGAEERAYARWGRSYAAVQQALLRSARIATRFAAFAGAYEIAGLAVFFSAVDLLRAPQESVGTLLITVTVFASFLSASNGFGMGILRVFLLLPRLSRARVLMESKPEVDVGNADPGPLSGRIEVSRLTFGYEADAPSVLQDVSFTVEPGEFVAIVGASGSGKSTLMKLLLGFERPRAGGVFYDGHDLKRLDPRAVRRQIGIVLQNGRPMSGSLAENILGVSGGGLEEAWAAARQAGLADDIEAMPMGMHTQLTTGGATLSGGQVQRLMIARALVARPRLLFLDEATSALDNRSQSKVTESLERTAATRIVIAHRLSTIRNADRIYVMDQGRIVQSGRFETLAATPGLFADLVARQSD